MRLGAMGLAVLFVACGDPNASEGAGGTGGGESVVVTPADGATEVPVLTNITVEVSGADVSELSAISASMVWGQGPGELAPENPNVPGELSVGGDNQVVFHPLRPCVGPPPTPSPSTVSATARCHRGR